MSVSSAVTVSPVIDYEPAPLSALLPARSALHRLTPRPPRRVGRCEPSPPRSAVTFAETALRQLLEFIDRRRPVSQLRPLMTPVLVEWVIEQAAGVRTGSTSMLRVRTRAVDTADDEVRAAEVFGSFRRAGRVHAIAARIERHRDSWRIVALQIG
ncbi:Rv3235 family protein [Mycolicibacterium vaccae]|uniref:Rv3235 family protein n=1 Tax=Mycolicibacterium vaccae TaxID=1810 RepID=UPI003CE85B94